MPTTDLCFHSFYLTKCIRAILVPVKSCRSDVTDQGSLRSFLDTLESIRWIEETNTNCVNDTHRVTTSFYVYIVNLVTNLVTCKIDSRSIKIYLYMIKRIPSQTVSQFTIYS